MEKNSFIGVDISKKTLDVAIYQPGVKYTTYPHIQVKNNEEGFKEIIKFLKKNDVTLKDAVIGMENTGIYGLDLRLFLEDQDIDYCVFMPVLLKRAMELYRGKNDKVDSQAIALQTWKNRDDLTFAKLSPIIFRNLRDLLAERKRFVGMRAQCKAIVTEYKNRDNTTMLERAKSTIDFLNERVDEIEKEMEELIKSDDSLSEKYDLVHSVKGIGVVNAVATIVYTGNFEFFNNARQYACYLGIAPFTHSSGTSVRGKTSVSKIGAKQLKADITQAAVSAITNDYELKEYYIRKIAEGKEIGKVLNAVKFKLIEHMFAVVKRGTPYVNVKGYAG